MLLSGSPRYFEPILHYLRTNNLVIHGIKLSSLRSEAEFYGIQKIVDHLDHLEKENAAKNEPQKGKNISKIFYCSILPH